MDTNTNILNTFRIASWIRRAVGFAVMPLLVTILLIAGSVTAGANSDPEIGLVLDSPRIALGEQTILTITVIGPSGFSEPVLPDVDGLDMTLGGRTQNVQIENMKVRSSKIFKYVVVPHRVGKFTIGPAIINRRRQAYKSGAVRLFVTESEKTETAAAGPKDIMAEAFVNNDNPYLGQQMTLIFRFARKASVQIRNASYNMPDLPDFWSEGVENKHEYSKKIGGIDYLITELAVPLFPVREGDVTIGSIALNYELVIPGDRSRRGSPFFRSPFGGNFSDDGFFKFPFFGQVVKQTGHTAPIRIHVRPLPHDGRPDDFTGGVGNFSVITRLSGNEVKVGESVTFTVVLSGQGNIRDLCDPDPQIDDVKIYSDTPVTNVKNYDEKVFGEKIYKLALVPQEAGRIHIPGVSIPYFNPETGRYETATSNPLILNVLPSEEESLVVARATEVQGAIKQRRLTKRDILPIHERIGPIESSRLEVWRLRLRPVVYPLPVVIYALCLAIVRHKERLRTDTAYRRYRFASRTAETHIEHAVRAANQKRWDEVFTECSRAVTEFLADKLNVPAGGLTSTDIRAALSSRGLPDKIVAEVVNFLEACDYGRFASSGESAGMAGKYIERAHRLINYLEREEAIKR